MAIVNVPAKNSTTHYLTISSRDRNSSVNQMYWPQVTHLPDTYFEYPAEEDGDGGDELADVDDEFLLQHGLCDVMREALTVQDVLDFLRRQRLVDHLLLLTEHSYRDL